MLKHTALYSEHQKAQATLVDFSGWEMPLHYGSQLTEHHYVRREAGMFDVSHMVVTDVLGAGATDFFRSLLANNIDKLSAPGRALYSCILNERGGILDDLIVYWIGTEHYRIVSNAGTRDKDRAWFAHVAKNYEVELHARDDLAILAIQGPHAAAKLAQHYTALADEIMGLPTFAFYTDQVRFIARTGYTGEDGFELILPANEVVAVWRALLDCGVHPCGLGARDTLRLEAGMNLYGQDMDESTTPYEVGLAWTVAMQPQERNFVGRAALEAYLQQPNPKKKTVGLVLLDRGVLRHGQKVYLSDNEIGEITSGSFSPTLNCAIALARVEPSIGENCEVLIRSKKFPAKVTKAQFVRKGHAVVDL